MARITKTIWTYSALAKKAMALRDSNPSEFESLLEDGSTTFLPGVVTRWHFGARASYFGMTTTTVNKAGRFKKWTLFSVYGNRRDGRWYSHYKIHLTPGLFPRKLVEQYLPVSLPDGVACSRNNSSAKTLCLYLRVDGSKYSQGFWLGSKAGRSGQPDRGIVFDDETGDLVDPVAIHDGRLTSTYQNAAYDLGWHPHQSKTRLDWVNSIKSMPGIDEMATLECALRACKAAMEVTAEHPSIRMMLLPATEWSSQFPVDLPSGDTSVGLRLGFQRWQPPRVILYWHDFYEEGDGESHWSTLCMTIPPHGHPGLDPTGKASPFARVRDDEVRPYHALVAWEPGPLARTGRPEPQFTQPVLMYGQDHVFSSLDKATVFWPENTDKVAVRLTTTEAKPLMKPGIWFAMRPSDVGALVESRFVIDSLPML